jgi:hypothetical protein
MEKLVIEFNTGSNDLRECIRVNNHTLVDPDIIPDEVYYKKCYNIFFHEIVNEDSNASLNHVAETLSKREESGMNLAMLAFTVGHIMATSSVEQRLLVANIMMKAPYRRVSESLKFYYERLLELYGSTTLASITVIFYFATTLVISQCVKDEEN